jgi:glycosyltransferase involved in cell wall biosynthesis
MMAFRVLFCTLAYFPAAAGGAEHQARLQAEELVRRGHQVTVACPRLPGMRSGKVNGVFVRRLPRANRRPFRTVTYLFSLTLYLLSQARRFDLVHVHLANLQADVVGLVATVLRRPVYVKLAAGGPKGEVARMRRIAWATRYVGLRRAARVQALSAEIERDVASAGVEAGRVVRIPNGLDVTMFRTPTVEDRERARASLGLPPEGVLVLYAGRFVAYKGVPELVQAWAARRAREGTLVMVGTRNEAEDAVVEVPSGERLIVREWTDRVLPYYQACDVFVLPSHVEGMSNALLQALACGMTIVATRVGSAEELVCDGESGILVRPRDVDELAAALDRVIGDRDLRVRLGAAATRAVAQDFSIASVVDRIEAEYCSMGR